MAQFPDTPSFTGFNKPSRIEADITDLQHEGEIPAELNGAFFRVQPDPQFPPMLGDSIAFDGDGMITRFHFHDGQCDFRQRWAKTDRWKAEKAAGRGLYGQIRSTAYTNAWIYCGKLWAMKEDSPALIMDPLTMETEAFETFEGAMKSQTFTAHPKIDPATGNMVAIGYAASGLCSDDVAYMEVAPDGSLVREKWFKVPYYCMMHDFGITEDYLVLHIVPSIGSWDRLEKGLPHFGFDTTMPVYLGIIPRRDDLKDEDIRWFKRDNCFASHVVNAWQEGTKVHFVVPEAQNNMFPFFPDVHGEPFNGAQAMSKLTRWTVDMASNGDEFDEIVRLTDTASEFPRIDDRYTGKKTRYTWGLEMDMSRPHEMKEERRTDLLVFDALDIEKGPVATIHVPIRLRFGLHGNFARSEDIGLESKKELEPA